MKNIILFSTVILLVLVPFAGAEQLFYNSLDSQEAVEVGGGTFHGGSFEPAIVENGFLSEADGQSISFPTEGNIQLDEGTVALWVKVMFPILDQPTESFIFLSYLRGDNAWFITHSHAWQANGVCWMIKNSGAWHGQNSCSEDLDWTDEETHFIAGTWGADGMKLYLDGELAGEEDFQGGPALLDDDFWIGSTDTKSLVSKWIQDEIYIFDTQLDENEVSNLMVSSVAVSEPSNALIATWGKLKTDF